MSANLGNLFTTNGKIDHKRLRSTFVIVLCVRSDSVSHEPEWPTPYWGGFEGKSDIHSLNVVHVPGRLGEGTLSYAAATSACIRQKNTTKIVVGLAPPKLVSS